MLDTRQDNGRKNARLSSEKFAIFITLVAATLFSSIDKTSQPVR